MFNANAAARVRQLLESCREAGMIDPSSLTSSPLREPLMMSLHDWAKSGPLCAAAAEELLQEIHITPGEAASDWLTALWKEGRPERPWPHLTRLLNILQEDGADAALRYLMMHMRNHVCDLHRKRQRYRAIDPVAADEAAGEEPLPEFDEDVMPLLRTRAAQYLRDLPPHIAEAILRRCDEDEDSPVPPT